MRYLRCGRRPVRSGAQHHAGALRLLRWPALPGCAAVGWQRAWTSAWCQPAGADAGGYADAAAQDAFCANTVCWITKIYDQSGKHNDLTQAPRGGFSGPALGGFNNVPVADMAPVTVMGHKVYGVFIEPGMGLRDDDPRGPRWAGSGGGSAMGDQMAGTSGRGCCFDYGNAEIDSRDDDNEDEALGHFGDAPYWFHGSAAGAVDHDRPGEQPGGMRQRGSIEAVQYDGSGLAICDCVWQKANRTPTGLQWAATAQRGELQVMFSGPRVNATYDPMRKTRGHLLGNGGDNSSSSQGTFYEGAVTQAGTVSADATDHKCRPTLWRPATARGPLSVAPASQVAAPPGLQTFSPGSSQETDGNVHEHDARAGDGGETEPWGAGTLARRG